MQHFQNQISLYFEFLHENLKPFIYFLKIDPTARYLFVAIITLCLVLTVTPKKRDKQPKNLTQNDMNAIAGEDVIATQLDLAKAYIEMDKKRLAKKMLKTIVTKGSQTQKKEAKQLIKAL